MKLLKDKEPPVGSDEGALWWATQRQMDPARFARDADFISWLEQPENAAAWDEIDRRVEAIGQYATTPEIQAMRRVALQRVQQRPSRPFPWAAGAALAASLAGALLVAQPELNLFDRPALSQVEQPRRYATATGERRDVVLTDGSKMSLNTGSLVEVRYSGERRDVRLLQGQALFHVAKNHARPFIVSAGDRQVTATGTAFDIRIRQDGAVNVLLVEGSVRVAPAKKEGLARIMPSLVATNLSPGEQLIAPPQGETSVVVADIERATAWNRGVLIFRNDRLTDAVAELNRYSQKQIVIDDARLAALKVSGVFPTARPQDFVAAIEALYPVASDRVSAKSIALRWRHGEIVLQE